MSDLATPGCHRGEPPTKGMRIGVGIIAWGAVVLGVVLVVSGSILSWGGS